MVILMLLGTSVLLCVPAWYLARRRKAWVGWDYVTLFAPIPLCFMLSFVQIGSQSLNNVVIELALVALFVPIALSFRMFVLDRFLENWRSSVLTCLACLILPLGLRLAMPLLPE